MSGLLLYLALFDEKNDWQNFCNWRLYGKKVFYLLSAAATRKETNVQTMIKCFRQYISCFGENGSEEGGIVFAYDTRKTEDVKTMYDILNKVYEMGKSV